MRGGNPLVIGIGVLALGIGASLPFYRAEPVQVAEQPEPLLLAHQPIPLQVTSDIRPIPDPQAPKLDANRRRLEPSPAPRRAPSRDPAEPQRSSAAPPRPADQFPELTPWSVSPRLAPTRESLLPLPISTPAERTARSSRPVPPIEPPSEPLEQKHRVVDGDSLHTIAARYLGDPGRYLEIFNANRDVLVNPDVLPIGAVLVIPTEPLAAMPEPN